MSLMAMEKVLVTYKKDPSIPPNFRGIAFKTKKSAVNVMKEIGSDIILDAIVFAYPNPEPVHVDDFEFNKYCEGQVKEISTLGHGNYYLINFFVGLVPIRTSVVNSLLQRSYDGSDSLGAEESGVEKTKYLSVLKSIWTLRTLFIMLKLPKTANNPELYEIVEAWRSLHET
jgi:hypothetical protein